MKHYLKTLTGLMALLASTGCSNMQMPHFGSQPAAQPQQQAQSQPAPAGNSSYANQTYASNTNDCRALASQRAAMFNKPDVYPTSPGEQQAAYQALYTQCVNGNTPQVAAASHNNVPYNVASASNFANLSPAAGGNYPAGNVVSANGAYVSSAGGPGGATVVVVGGNNPNTAAQLSSLSPSSGGSASSNPTVVYVQSPGAVPVAPVNGYYSPAPRAYYPSAATPSYYPPTTPLPVAVPIAPPQAQGTFPPAQTAAAAPHVTLQPQRPAQNPFTPPAAAYSPPAPAAPRQPSLASANANAATGGGSGSYAASDDASTQQLENVLEK